MQATKEAIAVATQLVEEEAERQQQAKITEYANDLCEALSKLGDNGGRLTYLASERSKAWRVHDLLSKSGYSCSQPEFKFDPEKESGLNSHHYEIRVTKINSD